MMEILARRAALESRFASIKEEMRILVAEIEETYQPSFPPEGLVICEVQSEYFGNHPEREEGDEQYLFALPPGCSTPRLTHGRRNTLRGQCALLPAETMVWGGRERAWITLAAWLNDNADD